MTTVTRDAAGYSPASVLFWCLLLTLLVMYFKMQLFACLYRCMVGGAIPMFVP